jgi:uncharacterized protein
VSVGLAIFVKTPGHSPVKTRLAQGSDARFAEAFHLGAARAVAEVARDCADDDSGDTTGLTPYWAVAEPAAADTAHWPGLPCLLQPGGDLGARMAGIHEQLMQRHDAAILIGADSPQLQPRWLRHAARWLSAASARCVIGPARDGGFWLFGANRRLPVERWGQVAYSRADTAARFRTAFATAGEWATLPELVDVDTVEDLQALRDALRALPTPLPAQLAQLAWLDAHPEHAARARPRTRSDA